MNSSDTPMQTTGRYLVLLPDTDISSGIRALTDATGISTVARAADFEGHAFTAEHLESSDAKVFDTLGVAVVSLDPNQVQSVRAAVASDSPVLAVEPERIVRAIGNLTATEFVDGAATWGLQATKVVDSPYSGSGIKVAVLDTGLDLTHPDFANRKITTQSFINGEDVQDRNGHGTHCIGTACGSKDVAGQPRYGIAYNAEIFAGKVLSNQGFGDDGSILAGIEWAITNGCRVISMSLGASVNPGDSFSQVYEQVGQRALQNSSLIIAAAGNESAGPDGRRKSPPNPVAHPANAPSIMAVAALDANLQVAAFSNGSINPNGGQVDIAGPGVNVYSTSPMPNRYSSASGTSMATPHVAGLAALYAEATGKTGQELWNLLMQNAQRL